MLRKIKSLPGHLDYAVRGLKVKDLLLSAFSAILLILSFPRSDLWMLAWFGFLPLFFVLKNKSKLQAFFLTYLAGVIFWLGIIYWLAHVTLAGMLILVLYLALYFGLFGLIIRSCELRTKRCVPVFVSSVWVLLEYLRSHLFTGFPWALLGYSQYLNLPAIQIADITGTWGVSFLVMLGNAGIYALLGSRLSAGGRAKKALLPLLCIITVLIYGYRRLYYLPSVTYYQSIKISVVQGNIPQELKWDAWAKEYILKRYFSLTQGLMPDNPDLIIWPEAAWPVVLQEEPSYYERLREFTRRINAPLLLGAVTLKDSLYYNSAVLFSGTAQLQGQYDKLHLVPFGEFIPFKKILGFLELVVPIGNFSCGREYTVFEIQDSSAKAKSRKEQENGSMQNSRIPNNFSVLICFEDLFPRLSRRFMQAGADFLINITNDAWFKDTASPYQHLQASVLRAVENRANLVRSANTGVSGFIAPSGKIISLLQDSSGRNTFIPGYLTQELRIAKISPTFYTRYGDIFVLGLLIFNLYVALRLIKR